MSMAEELTQNGVKVIDLAADFRLKDTEEFKKWYKMEHTCPDILKKAVYGQPETMRDKMKDAMVLGMAGCYPTSIQLGLLPLLELHKKVGNIVDIKQTLPIVNPASVVQEEKQQLIYFVQKQRITLRLME